MLLIGRQAPTELQLDELLCFDTGECEVGHPDVAELTLGPQGCQRQRWIVPGDDHEMGRRGELSKQLGHQAMGPRRGDEVVVIEHDHDRLVEFVQLVRQFGDQRLVIRDFGRTHHL